jgi:hypothetical protein
VPEFAGVDLGLAERSAVRAVATVVGALARAGGRGRARDRRPGCLAPYERQVSLA